jgi:chemotaxis protein MotC
MKRVAYSVALIFWSLQSAPLPAMGAAAAPQGPTEQAAPAPSPAEGGQAATPAEAKEPGPEVEQPFQLVRTLEKVQDRIALGNFNAHGFQRQFITEIGDKMLAAPDSVWQEPKNIRSAVVYVLSGGDPRILQKLVKLEKLPEIPSNLLPGVLAYSAGRNGEALKLLTDIDHRAFDTRTGGHLALAKAMVFAPEDAAKSLGFLDDARLLCPGTLVEEAALRRQVLLLGSIEDFARFEMLAFEYLRRFGQSVYAGNFGRSFAVAVTSSKMSTDPALIGRLEMLLDELGDDSRRRLYMAIAEEGVTRARVELVRLAADKIAYLIPDGSREFVRLQLYKAAALVVTNEYEFAVAKLNALDRSKLGRTELRLLDQALAIAAQLRQPAVVSGPVDELPPLSSAAQVRHGDIASKSEALDTARTALAQAEKVLSREPK